MTRSSITTENVLACIADGHLDLKRLLTAIDGIRPKKCPGCKTLPTLNIYDNGSEPNLFNMECSNCGISGEKDMHKQVAIYNWNRLKLS